MGEKRRRFQMHDDIHEQDWSLLHVTNFCTCKYHPVNMSKFKCGDLFDDAIHDIFDRVARDRMPNVAGRVCDYLRKAKYPSTVFLDFLMSPHLEYPKRRTMLGEIFEYLLFRQNLVCPGRGAYCFKHGYRKE